MTRSLHLAPFLLLLAACQADVRADDPAAATDIAFVGRDSAGIKIVEIPEDAWGEEATSCVGAEPVLSIGMLDGPPEYELAQVAAAIRLDDGTVVVSNAGSGEIRFYAADGVHVRSVGRRGEGPGEFRSATLLARYGADSILVWDGLLSRGSVLGKDGSLGRTIPTPSVDRSVVIVGPFSDGSLLGHLSPLGLPADLPLGRVRQEATFFRSGRSGEVDSIARLFLSEGYTSGGSYRYRIPFKRSGLAVAAGMFMHYGSSDTYEIRTHAATGELVRIIRSPRATPLSRRELESALDAAGLDDELSRMSFPETKPAYSAMKADADGNLWVRDYIDRGEADAVQRWTIFGAAGDMRGWITTPARFTVLDIGRDYLLGVGRDVLDVERVLVYPLMSAGCNG